MILVNFGLFNHSARVTKEEAIMGMMLYHFENVRMPSAKLISIKTITHIGVFAHFFLLRCKNRISLKNPTKFGIIPAVAPRQK